MLLLLLNSCTKTTSDYTTSGAETVFIRGYQARNDMGQTLASIGNPDIQLTYPQSLNPFYADLFISSFPNPATTSMMIYLNNRHVTDDTRIWIVPASFTGSGSEATIFLGTALFASSGKPVIDKVFNKYAGYPLNFRINNLQEGYYRVYAKSGGNIVWDNIVFSKAVQHYY